MMESRRGWRIGWFVRNVAAAAGCHLAPAVLSLGGVAGAQQEQAELSRAPERSSPFEAVRWTRAGDPEVRVEGVWYIPVSIEGLAVTEVLQHCGKAYGELARKRFEEDLVEVLRAMGQDPRARVTLVVRGLEGGEVRTIGGVLMSESNRRRIREAAAAREEDRGDAQGVGLPSRLSRKEAYSVVDRLESVLGGHHAYTAAFGHDPGELLAPVRRSIEAATEEEITASRLAVWLEHAIARVGDGHAEVVAGRPEEPACFLPATLAAVTVGGERRVAGIEPGARRLLDPGYPFVISIDGVPIERWMRQASAGVTQGSPQLVERRALRAMADVTRMRGELGLTIEGDAARTVTMTLANAAGESRTAAKAVGTTIAPRPTHARLAKDVLGGVAYVRIERMVGDGVEARAIRSACLGAGSEGLIIDLRGNGGGDRFLIEEIGRLILPADATPVVFNAARPMRLPGERADELRARMDSRSLRPADDERWTREEREEVARFAAAFEPELALDDATFHRWHYAVLSPAKADEPRVRGRVVVLMDAGCFSAADIFLCAFGRIPGVTLVGTNSGGGSGLTRWHDLGHGLKARLSTMVSFQPDGRLLDGKGVTPSVVVEPNLADFTGDRDTMLEHAVRVLRSKGGR